MPVYVVGTQKNQNNEMINLSSPLPSPPLDMIYKQTLKLIDIYLDQCAKSLMVYASYSYQGKTQNVTKLKQYLTLYSVNMTYNLKKSIIQWESVRICICLHPGGGSLSAQCVVLK